MIPYKKQKLYYVKWQDAHSNPGWYSEEKLEHEIKHEKCVCEEVGWVVYEDKSELHIVSRRCEWDTDRQYGQYQRIPKAWVMKKRLIV